MADTDDPSSAEQTIDINSAGDAVAIRTLGASTVSLAVEGDATAEYQFDMRTRGGTWRQNVGSSYTGSANYDDVRTTGADEIRIRCSNGTAGTTDTADITLSAN